MALALGFAAASGAAHAALPCEGLVSITPEASTIVTTSEECSISDRKRSCLRRSDARAARAAVMSVMESTTA